MKRLILALMTSILFIQSAPAYAWSESHCNTAVGETRAQKGKLLKQCIGKFSEDKYAGILLDYVKLNGVTEDPTVVPKRVAEVIVKAVTALEDEDQKWMSENKQAAIDNGKFAAIIAGSLFAAVTAVTVAAGGVIMLLPAGGALSASNAPTDLVIYSGL